MIYANLLTTQISNKAYIYCLINETLAQKYYHLPGYLAIMNNVNCSSTNRGYTVAKDLKFQNFFKNYYKIYHRGSIPNWSNNYFDIFDMALSNSKGFAKGSRQKYAFKVILYFMYKKTGQLECSFCSKIIATINPDMPIWDTKVIGNLGFASDQDYKIAKNLRLTRNDRINAADRVYNKIINWYKNNGQHFINVFNQMFPNPQYISISDTKKIDTIIWGI